MKTFVDSCVFIGSFDPDSVNLARQLDCLRNCGGVNNAINHEEALRPMLDRALADNRVDALIVPIGKGELVCRKK